MLMNSEMLLELAKDRQGELIAEAHRNHLLTSARRARHARKTSAARRQRTGTLASCEPSAAVPPR